MEWDCTQTAIVSGFAGASWEPQKLRSPGKLVNRNQLGERAQLSARGRRASSLKPRAVSEAGLLCQARQLAWQTHLSWLSRRALELRPQ